ncbi:MAG TPA: division/cell wall cluster transcriptional repressor MraZ [Allosphingosinicella sp.]
MEVEDFFQGSALNAVDAKGRLSVPAFVRSVIERRSDSRAIVVGAHEVAPCLTAYGRNYARNLWTDLERRRLAEEERGGTLDDHYARARRMFGMTEDVPYDTSGRIVLPPMMRRKGRIEDLALFVGIGGIVEIWNPRIALVEGDRDLKEIAAWRLEEKGIAP